MSKPWLNKLAIWSSFFLVLSCKDKDRLAKDAVTAKSNPGKSVTAKAAANSDSGGSVRSDSDIDADAKPSLGLSASQLGIHARKTGARVLNELNQVATRAEELGENIPLKDILTQVAARANQVAAEVKKELGKNIPFTDTDRVTHAADEGSAGVENPPLTRVSQDASENPPFINNIWNKTNAAMKELGENIPVENILNQFSTGAEVLRENIPVENILNQFSTGAGVFRESVLPLINNIWNQTDARASVNGGRTYSNLIRANRSRQSGASVQTI